MLIDRSRIDTRLLCKMKRWWQYDFLGRGITKIKEPDTADARDVGQMFHTGAELLLIGEQIEIAIAKALDGVKNEQVQYLIEGMLRGWQKKRLPLIHQDYSVLETETQHNVDFGGITIPIRRDALLRRKVDQALVVLDYKTLGYYTEGWDSMLENSLQTLLYVYATEQLSGERCAGIQYEGIVKGKMENKEIQSPYCSAYTDGKEWQIKYTNRKGWERRPIKEFGSPKAWADYLDKTDSYAKLFQVVPPRRPLSHIMQTIVAQVVENELLYKRYLTMGNGDAFRFLEYNPNACFKYGSNYPCEFYALCYGGQDVQQYTSIPDGYEIRRGHHAEE